MVPTIPDGRTQARTQIYRGAIVTSMPRLPQADTTI